MLTLKTSTWTQHLWNAHVEASSSASRAVDTGTRQHSSFPALADDLHALLYLRHRPKATDTPPAWAVTALETLDEMPEFQRLRVRCMERTLGAAVATEALLGALAPLMPTEDRHEARKGKKGAPPSPRKEYPPVPLTDEDRGTIRRACRAALAQADDAQAMVDDLVGACGLDPGSECRSEDGTTDADRARLLYLQLLDNPTLQQLARLVGRMQRLAQSSRRARLLDGPGEIVGVTLGGDLARVLPSELAGLRSPQRLRRLDTLHKLMSKRALQYDTRTREDEGRGPILVLLDQSGSMGSPPGDWDAYAKALTLALLTTAQRQRRAWHLIAFENCLMGEVRCPAGEASLATLMDVLAFTPAGGTNFERPLDRARQLLATEPTMRKADVVLITDGFATVSMETIDAYQDLQAQGGVSVYSLLMGKIFESQRWEHREMLKRLQALSTATYQLQSKDDVLELAPMLGAIAATA